MRSDEELMSNVAQGDLDAFEQLVRRHQVSVWNTAFRFLRNADDAEDVEQDALLRVLQAAGRYRPTATFRTYLYRIVTRLCRDRRQKMAPSSCLDPDGEITPTPSPVNDAIEVEERRAVKEALASLPDAYKEAIVLRYYENLSYSEIVQVIGTSCRVVERLLARGRYALAARLGRRLGK